MPIGVSRLPRRLCVTAAVLLTLTSPAGTWAQLRPAAWPHTSASPAFHLEEVTLVGVGAASAALVLPADQKVRLWSQTARISGNVLLQRLGRAFSPIGEPLPKYVSGAVFVAGLLTQNEELRDAGLITGEALLATTVAHGLLKRVAGRSRPGVDDHEVMDFSLGRGFRSDDYRSFPSGHASNAFALTAAVSEELREVWKGGAPWVTGILAGAATITSLSRVLEDEHWLSDLLAGAALGTVVGSVVADLNGR